MLGLIKALALPPGNLLLLALVGLGIRRRHARLGTGLAALAVGSLYLLCTPYFSSLCLSLLESPYVDPLSLPQGEAIAALGRTSSFTT